MGTSARRFFEHHRHGWWIVLGALSVAGWLGGWRWLAFSTMLVLADLILRAFRRRSAGGA